MTSPATLPQRMIEAAETLRLVNGAYGFQADYGVWNPKQLCHEAEVLQS